MTILAGILCQVMQLVVSIRDREELRDVTGDPWMGRSLEWSTASPPPAFNYAVLPVVEDRDDYWRRARLAERRSGPTVEPVYKAIEMPRNSPTGFMCAFFASFGGFGMIWQIWWLVIFAIVGAFATFVVFAWRDRTEYEIPAEEVARIDRANRRARGEAVTTVEAVYDGLSGRRGLRRRPARGGAGPSRSRFRSLRPGVEAHHCRLRLFRSSCSATLLCSRRFSPPMRCSPARPREDRAARICSTCTMSRSKPPASCFLVLPAARRDRREGA